MLARVVYPALNLVMYPLFGYSQDEGTSFAVVGHGHTKVNCEFDDAEALHTQHCSGSTDASDERSLQSHNCPRNYKQRRLITYIYIDRQNSRQFVPAKRPLNSIQKNVPHLNLNDTTRSFQFHAVLNSSHITPPFYFLRPRRTISFATVGEVIHAQ